MCYSDLYLNSNEGAIDFMKSQIGSQLKAKLSVSSFCPSVFRSELPRSHVSRRSMSQIVMKERTSKLHPFHNRTSTCTLITLSVVSKFKLKAMTWGSKTNVHKPHQHDNVVFGQMFSFFFIISVSSMIVRSYVRMNNS